MAVSLSHLNSKPPIIEILLALTSCKVKYLHYLPRNQVAYFAGVTLNFYQERVILLKKQRTLGENILPASILSSELWTSGYNRLQQEIFTTMFLLRKNKIV